MGQIAEKWSNDWQREHYLANRDKILKEKAAWRAENREAIRSYNSEWRKGNKHRIKGYSHSYRIKRLAERNAFLAKAKDVPCADCGNKYPPYVMDFDHVRGVKSFSIAQTSYTKPLRDLKREIEKCEVVCANCHRIRTHSKSHEKFS